ncbi:MAG: hypothetical protein JXB50_01440 [Spirochaetes bacterium]|nr:hypothetical protein [Spirochaetota bacterium]
MGFLNYKFVITVIFITLNILSGIILTIKGMPYNSLLTNIHKISALIFGISFVMIIISSLKMNDAGTSSVLLIVLSGLLFIISMASGGLIIALKNANNVVLYIHRIIPFISIIIMIITLYILN